MKSGLPGADRATSVHTGCDLHFGAAKMQRTTRATKNPEFDRIQGFLWPFCDIILDFRLKKHGFLSDTLSPHPFLKEAGCLLVKRKHLGITSKSVTVYPK